LTGNGQAQQLVSFPPLLFLLVAFVSRDSCNQFLKLTLG